MRGMGREESLLGANRNNSIFQMFDNNAQKNDEQFEASPGKGPHRLAKRMSSLVPVDDSNTPRAYRPRETSQLRLNSSNIFSQGGFEMPPIEENMPLATMNDTQMDQKNSLFPDSIMGRKFSFNPTKEPEQPEPVKIDIGAAACLDLGSINPVATAAVTSGVRRAAKIQQKANKKVKQTKKKKMNVAEIEDLDESSLESILSHKRSTVGNDTLLMKRGRKPHDPTKYCFESQKKIDNLQ